MKMSSGDNLAQARARMRLRPLNFPFTVYHILEKYTVQACNDACARNDYIHMCILWIESVHIRKRRRHRRRRQHRQRANRATARKGSTHATIPYV